MGKVCLELFYCSVYSFILRFFQTFPKMGNKPCMGEVSSIPPNGDVKQTDGQESLRFRERSPLEIQIWGFLSMQTEPSAITLNEHSQEGSRDKIMHAEDFPEDPNIIKAGSLCRSQQKMRRQGCQKQKKENVSRRWEYSTDKCFYSFIHVFQIRSKKTPRLQS